MLATEVPAAATTALTGGVPDRGPDHGATTPRDRTLDDHDGVRQRLLQEIEGLVGYWQKVVADVDSRLAGEQEAVKKARAACDELTARGEPDPPRLGW